MTKPTRRFFLMMIQKGIADKKAMVAEEIRKPMRLPRVLRKDAVSETARKERVTHLLASRCG